jgi:uncharacterized protein (DUF305 family)
MDHGSGMGATKALMAKIVTDQQAEITQMRNLRTTV